eukprot:CAMPEP_0204635624 /NCGR_PEP_ID=MMETSP0717-20131115/31823_1 /ASSEMBLY_ACC=CAM_ASM_000666 /TAXON_ID=230516 /ORGANISM="Chaetoceros curvisetus" /LENGTH=53 /DNA_ID=CAMNT_0051654411 /DNA_START=5 /DNA_END=163 /DNA_ORIENTATION=+
MNPTNRPSTSAPSHHPNATPSKPPSGAPSYHPYSSTSTPTLTNANEPACTVTN